MHSNDNKKARIYIDKEGNWFQDGIQIVHKWTYLYNNNLLDIDKDGRFYIDEGRGRVYAEVEDTPFVVKIIDIDDDNITLILNDESTEILASDTLYLNSENIPYAKVKSGRFDARFSRAAYYELMKVLEFSDDRYYLLIGSEKLDIRQIG